MGRAKSRKTKPLPAKVEHTPAPVPAVGPVAASGRPESAPSSFIVILNFFVFILEAYSFYIGWCLVGAFLILPAMPDIKDMVKSIISASPEQIEAFGVAIWEPIKTGKFFAILFLGALFLLSFMANILFWFNNRRNIAKIGELRKKLESLDPCRSSSGLNKYGERV